MPISKSAKKALRSSRSKHEHNLVSKLKLRTALKASKKNNLDEIYSCLDQAVKKKIIHKNKAARLKSRFAKKQSPEVKASPPKKTVKHKKKK